MTQDSREQIPLLATDAKEVFRDLRNHLAGRWVGGTRDDAILNEVVTCLFGRAYLESSGATDPGEALPSDQVADSYRAALSQIGKIVPGPFHATNGELALGPDLLSYVDRRLATLSLTTASRDPFGDVYEAFRGTVYRGSEGQFFTPRNAVDLLVSLVKPEPGETVIDPACGAGTFLSTVAQRWLAQDVLAEDVAAHLFGVDKDQYLAALASARLSLLTLRDSNIVCADSLAWAGPKGQPLSLSRGIGQFDIVLTNPPFGSRVTAASDTVQRDFDLGFRWESDQGTYRRTGELLPAVPPQVLFVERCVALVRPGGRIGMVLPESLVSGRKYRHVVAFLRNQTSLEAVIGMPEALFKTSGRGGTHTKTCLVVCRRHSEEGEQEQESRRVFMAEARWCGHDSRGRRIDRDDLPAVLENFERYERGELDGYDPLGYAIPAQRLESNVLAPRYYNEAVRASLRDLESTHRLVKLGELIELGILEKRTGDEVGKLAYGTGDVPFVRTSDISNWEIKVDPKHCVSEEIFEELAGKQDVRAGDILMVKDGTYLIGTCALVTTYDERIVYQSHLYKLRSLDQEKLSPYLLLALLSSSIVQRQIKAKRFTHDIIDSLGSRVDDLVLPIPKDDARREAITSMVRQAISDRVEARELAREACEMIDAPETDQ